MDDAGLTDRRVFQPVQSPRANEAFGDAEVQDLVMQTQTSEAVWLLKICG